MKRILLVVSIALAGVCVIALMRVAAVPGKYPKPTIDGVALVNKEAVPLEEFREYVDAASKARHFAAGTVQELQLHEVEGLLTSYIKKQILIYQDARKQGIYESEDFQRAYELAENQLVARKFSKTELRELLEVTDDELADIIPTQWIHLKMRQILLANRGEAESVRAAIMEGTDFIELLRERSIGPGAARDGDLGYRFPGTGYFSPADDVYLFTLEKGDISEVVDTPLGPAVVRIEDKKVFDEHEIQAMMEKPRGTIFNEKLQKHIAEIREEVGVEIYDAALYKCVETMEDGRKKDALIAKAGEREFYFFDIQRVILKAYDQIYIEPDVKQLFSLYQSNINGRVTEYLLAQEARMFGIKADTDWEKKELGKYKRIVAIRLEAERIFADLEVTDEEAREYFRENPMEFNSVERLRLWQIFVKDESTAKLVHDKLLAGGNFRELATEYTEEEQAKKSAGFVGTLTRKDMTPELAEAAFALLPGDFSDVVKSELGYHIVSVDASYSAKTYEFDEIRGKVRKTILRGKQEERFNEFVETLYSKAVIEVNDEALRELIADSKNAKRKAPPSHFGGSPGGAGASPHGADGMPTTSSGASPHGPGGALPTNSSGASPHGSGGMPANSSGASPHGSN
jgi:parvulin-like peptidyl-prolyl isomerase